MLFLYEFEHGKRISMPSVTASPQRWHQVVSQRSTIFRYTRAEVAAAGVVPGTECAMSTMSVRITSRDRVVDAGPIKIDADRTHTVPIAPIVGVIALVGGIALFATGGRRGP